MRRVCLAQKNIRKYVSRYHVKCVGSKCWGRDIAAKMAKWWSEEFQKVSKVSCEYLSDSFLLCLTLFWCNVTLFPSSLCSMITLGLLPLYFGSRMIFFTCRLPPGWFKFPNGLV